MIERHYSALIDTARESSLERLDGVTGTARLARR